MGGCKVSAAQPSQVSLNIASVWSLKYKVCMGTTYYSLGGKLHQRTTFIAKIVIFAIGETLLGTLK